MNVAWMISLNNGMATLNKADKAKTLLGLLIFCVGLTACDKSENVPRVDPNARVDPAMLERYEVADPDALLPENFYFIGVDRQYKTIDSIKKNRALLAYLEETTGFQFELLYSSKNQSVAEMLGDDLVQFAMIDGISLVWVAHEYGAEPLARDTTLEKRTVFVVQADSPITSLKDIQLKSLALSIKGSIEGDLKPRVMLKKVGLLLSNINRVYYADSAKECLRDVIREAVNICALEERLATTYIEGGKLRVLERSSWYPTYGVANNIYVDSQVAKRVQQALVDYEQGSFVAGDPGVFNMLVEQLKAFDLYGPRKQQ